MHAYLENYLDPVIEHISSFLPPRDLDNFNLLNKRIHQLIQPAIPNILKSQIEGSKHLTTYAEYRMWKRASSLNPKEPSLDIRNLDVTASNIEDEEFKELMASCPNLKNLSLCECNKITDRGLACLPKSLLHLHLKRCDGFTDAAFASLPELESLSLSGCENLSTEAWPPLPKTLRILSLSCFDKITEETLANLYQTLQELIISECPCITSLPFLESLEVLDISYCDGITGSALTSLPNGLQKLRLARCQAITFIPFIPEELKILTIIMCEELTSLPRLPKTLRSLELTGCDSLRRSPSFPDSLTTIQISSCKNLTNDRASEELTR